MLTFSRVTFRLLLFLAALGFHLVLSQPSMAITSAGAVAGPAAQVEVLPGNNMFVLVDVPIPLGARVIDAAGQPVPEVLVTFRITSGPGVLAELEALTNTQGEAMTSIMVPTVLVPTCITVSVADLEPMLAVVTGVPEENLHLIEVSGNNQEASPGQVLEEPFVVRVESEFESSGLACVADNGSLVARTPPGASLNQGGGQPQRVPVVGVQVTAEIIQGKAAFVVEAAQLPVPDRTQVVTDAQGEARFFLRIEKQARDRVVVKVATADIPQVEPVQFVTLIGFPFPRGIAVEADGSLVVVDISLQAILRVDPLTGQRTIVSSREVGSGPPFGLLFGIAVEADGSLVVVYTGSSLDIVSAVVRVDPRTGDRTVVSGGNQNIGSGPFSLAPTGIAVEANGDLVLVDDFNKAVMRIDPTTGARRIISRANTMGSGPSLERPFGIAVGPDGSLTVLDNGRRALVQVDPRSGDRTILSGDGVGEDLAFENPNALTVEADGSLLVADDGRTTATEKGRKRVVRVDRANGARTLVSGDGVAAEVIGNGPAFLVLTAIAAAPDGAIIVGDTGRGAIMQVAPISGDRAIISEARFGSGPPFASPWRLAIEPDGSLIVIDDIFDAVMRVDPTTGDRLIVSDEAGTGSGPPFVNPIAIEVEADGMLVVADEGADAVMRVDPHSGERFIVSGAVPPVARGRCC